MSAAKVVKTFEYSDERVTVVTYIFDDGEVNTSTTHKKSPQTVYANRWIMQGIVLLAVAEGRATNAKEIYKVAISAGYKHYPKLEAFGHIKFRKDGTCYLTPVGKGRLDWIRKETWGLLV